MHHFQRAGAVRSQIFRRQSYCGALRHGSRSRAALGTADLGDQERQRRRGDPIDPTGLADGLGPQGLKLLAELMGQPS